MQNKMLYTSRDRDNIIPKKPVKREKNNEKKRDNCPAKCETKEGKSL